MSSKHSQLHEGFFPNLYKSILKYLKYLIILKQHMIQGCIHKITFSLALFLKIAGLIQFYMYRLVLTVLGCWFFFIYRMKHIKSTHPTDVIFFMNKIQNHDVGTSILS